MVCARCGHRNALGGNFCSSCGAPLDVPSEGGTTVALAIPVEGPEGEVSVEPGDLTGGIGMLVVKRGPNSGSKFSLEEPLVSAGRHPDSDIFLDDITVSRRHVEILRDGDRYRVRDVGSLNGTYLNRERVEEALLADGDELQIGSFKLVFLAGRP